MEEASSYEEDEDEDDEIDDDDENDDSGGSFPVISFHDSQSVVSGLTEVDLDVDVSRLTLLKVELHELKQRAVAEGDDFSKEELIRCLDRLQNIQKDVIQEVAGGSVASEVQDSFRHVKDPKSDSEWEESDTDAELDVAQAALAERKELSGTQLTTSSDSPKLVQENRKSRKMQKQVFQEISEAATPRANNKSRKSDFSNQTPPSKKKKKRKSKEKKQRSKRELDADANPAVAADAKPKVKRKKDVGGKTKKKRKSKKKLSSKTKRKSDKGKNVDTSEDESIDMGQKYVDLNDLADDNDTDKTPRRRTAKGTVAMGDKGKSTSPSYIKTHTERLFRHPLFQSNLDVPTNPEVTEPVDGDLNGSPSAIPRRSAEQRENSRRSRRTLPMAPNTDPNAAKRRTLPRFMSSRNVTPSPKSPGRFNMKSFSNPSLGIYVSLPTPPQTPDQASSVSKVPVPDTDPTAGKRRSLSRFLSVRGRDGATMESQSSLNAKKVVGGTSSKRNSKQHQEEVDPGNETDHAVVDTERTSRFQRSGSIGRLFNSRGETESPSSIRSNKKAVRDGKSNQEKAELNETDHAVADLEHSTRRQRRGSLGSLGGLFNNRGTTESSYKKANRGGKSKQEREALNETDHAVADSKRFPRKHQRGRLGSIFIGRGSGHSLSSSMRMQSTAGDTEDVSSPSEIPRRKLEAPVTGPAATRRSIGRLFNGRSRSKSPSSINVRKPQSSSTLGDVSSPSEIPRESLASGESDADTSSGKRRSFGRLLNGRSRSKSPSNLFRKPQSSSTLGDVDDISSPSDARIPETDPRAAKRRSHSRPLFPMVPDLLDSGDELEDSEVRESSRRGSRHSSRYVHLDSSGHLRSMAPPPPPPPDDDQLDLEHTSNHSTGEKGGRKARRGSRRTTLSPSPRQRLRKKRGDNDGSAKSLARAKERREQLLPKDRGESSNEATTNGVGRAPRKKKTLSKTKKSSRSKKADAGGNEPTEQEEAQVGERSSGSSRGLRSISKMVTRMRRNKRTETIDC
ncbi:MAG: hypothetical protein SGBAC_011087 [Bacillariaceae sp.]